MLQFTAPGDASSLCEPSPSPPTLRTPYPGIAQSLALGVLFYVIVGLVAIVLPLLEHFARVSVDAITSMLIGNVIAWPVTLWAGLRRSGARLLEAYPLTPFPARIVPALLIASFGAIILVGEAANLIPTTEAFRRLLEEVEAGSKLTRFFAGVVVAPLAEELFFRGLVLRGFLGRYSVTKAVWASSVLFALFHLNPWQAVMALPLGLCFAWLFLRTGSLLPGILGHATVNFTGFFLLSPLAHALGYYEQVLNLKALGHSPPSMLAIGGAMAGAGGLVLWRLLRPDDHVVS